MPWTTGRVVVETDSALLVGGHSEAPGFLDTGAARRTSVDGTHEPVLPGSAVRGMLREALVRWLGPQRAGDDGPLHRLFGVPGADRPGLEEEAPRQESRQGLRFDDAVLQSGSRDVGVRTGVGVDRRTGHAAAGHLYQRQVAEVRGATFAGPFEGDVAPEDLALLVEAAALADGLGNSRSRGLGEIRVRLEVDDAAVRHRPITQSLSADLDTDAVAVTVVAAADLHLGAVPDRSSLRESLPFVPGSALRGALVWAAVDAGLRGAPGFEDLAAASFSDLWTGDPSPRTRVGCDCDAGHLEFVADAILAESLRPRILERLGGAPALWTCPRCPAALRPKPKLPDVQSRLVTRLALDPKTGSAAPGMLHSRQQILAGTRFHGTASGLGPAARGLLARLDRPVRVGGLRSRGLGEVTVELGPVPRRDFTDAAARFDAAARRVVPDALAEVLDLPGRGWLQLVARTPLRLPDAAEPGDAEAFLASLLPTGTRCAGSHQRTGARSGWRDGSWAGQAARTEPVRWVLQAGSTWLFRLPCPATDPEVSAFLVHAATAGVGELRELGLGRLVPRLERLPLTPSEER